MLAVQRGGDAGEVLDAVGSRRHVDRGRLGDGLAGVGHLQLRRELVVAVPEQPDRFPKTRPRSVPVMARQVSYPLRADHGRSTSASDACCTSAITVPVAGLMVGKVSADVALTAGAVDPKADHEGSLPLMAAADSIVPRSIASRAEPGKRYAGPWACTAATTVPSASSTGAATELMSSANSPDTHADPCFRIAASRPATSTGSVTLCEVLRAIGWEGRRQ